MATAAQIQANLRNAARSTGPRTTNGKQRVRENALKHGRYATTLVPGLPHEDRQQVQERIDRYLDDWQPRNDSELDLVCQAARLSLTIERAERMEIAHMAGRIQAAAQERAQEIHPRRLEEIQEQGRRLLYIAASDEIKRADKLPWSDDPRLLVARLEATADGCRWLLARWTEFRRLLEAKTRWDVPVVLRFIRLQGKLVDEAVFDPQLNSIFLAWDVIVPKFARHYWEEFREVRSEAEFACLYSLRWREIAPRPRDEGEAWKVLHQIVDQHTQRLEVLLERNKNLECEELAGWSDRAALDLSPEFERHRRYLSAKTREFHRTLDALRKMRKEGGGPEGEDKREKEKGERQTGEGEMADDKCQTAGGEAEVTEREWQMADGKCQTGMADGKCQTGMADGKAEMGEGEWQMTDGEVQRGEGGEARVDGEEKTLENDSPAGEKLVREEVAAESLLADSSMGQKNGNKANLELEQVTEAMELRSETASAEAAEQTQFPRGMGDRQAAPKSDRRPGRASVTVRAGSPPVADRARRPDPGSDSSLNPLHEFPPDAREHARSDDSGYAIDS